MDTQNLHDIDSERYKDVVDNIPCGLVKVRLDANGESKPIFVNKAFLKMTDMSRDEFMDLYGSDTLAGLHPDDHERAGKVLWDSKDGDEKNIEFRLRKGKDGWVWVRVTAFFKEENGALMLYNNYLDVSAEHEKDFMLNSLLNHMPGGAAIFKAAQTFECQYFNDGFAKLTERTCEELEAVLNSENFIETVIYPPDLQHFTDSINRSAASGKDITITSRYITKNGEVRWLNMVASKMREENGCPVYYCVFITPPDESALYQSMAENSSIGIVVSDIQSHEICYTNQAFRAMLHIGENVPAGAKCYSHIRGRSQPCDECAAIKLKPGENITSLYHLAEYGTYLQIKSSLIQWAGHTALLEYNVDITAEYEERRHQQELINRVPAGIAMYEIIDGKPSEGYFNDYFYEMVRQTREIRKSQIRENTWTFIHPQDMPKLNTVIDNIISGSDSESMLHRILCGDGEYRWFKLNISVARREGRKIKLYCSYTDFDETVKSRIAQEKTAAALQKKYEVELAQRKLLEQESAMTVQFNATRWRLISCTKTRDQYCTYPGGIDVDEIFDALQKKMLTEAERQRLREFYNRDRILAEFNNGENELTADFRLRLRDGQLHWMRHICRMMQDESGDVIVYVFINDISAEKENEQVIECIIDDETDIVMLTSTITRMARFLSLNRQRSYLRQDIDVLFPFDTFKNMEDFTSILPEYSDDLSDFFDLDKLQERLNSTSPISVTYRKLRKDGLIRHKKAQAFFLNETHEDVVITTKDITESYEQEQRINHELMAANRAKSEFLSRVSHDMRTPLNAVLGFTRLMQSDANLPDTATEYLKYINESGLYLLGLINDVLDMSKIEEGKLELHAEPYNYTDFRDAICTIIEPIAKEKGIDFLMRSNVDAPEAVMFDKLRLQQIFINLLNNAIKFTPRGGRVDFSVIKGKAATDGTIPHTFIVRDNGVGMSEEFVKDKLYQAFEQERNLRDQPETGTGLGLSIAKQLVDQMGGTIECESRQGLGTTFTVRLFPKAAEVITGGEAKPDAAFDNLSGAHILLCEDNHLNAVIARRLLEKAGCTVDTAENGRLGLEQFSASEPGTYAAILMDIRMPELDGLGAARAIRTIERADAGTVPIIAMSANAFEEDIKASLDAGMNAHIAKPVEPRKLYETLAAQIAGKGGEKNDVK